MNIPDNTKIRYSESIITGWFFFGTWMDYFPLPNWVGWNQINCRTPPGLRPLRPGGDDSRVPPGERLQLRRRPRPRHGRRRVQPVDGELRNGVQRDAEAPRRPRDQRRSLGIPMGFPWNMAVFMETVGEIWITGWWFGTWLLFFPYIGNVIIPTDYYLFRGVGIPPTR